MKFLFKFEDKIKNWIEENPFKWISLLVIISYSVGILGIIFLGMGIRQAFIMGSIYATVLIIVELSTRTDR